MRTKKYSILLVFLFFLSCKPEVIKNAQAQHNLNGKVKSNNEYTYAFTQKPGQTGKDLLYSRSYSYNAKGESASYYEAGGNHVLDSALLHSRYDDMGKLNMFSFDNWGNQSKLSETRVDYTILLAVGLNGKTETPLIPGLFK